MIHRLKHLCVKIGEEKKKFRPWFHTDRTGVNSAEFPGFTGNRFREFVKLSLRISTDLPLANCTCETRYQVRTNAVNDPFTNIASILNSYPPECHPTGKVHSLGGAGGFSGARIWKFKSKLGLMCLRCWPKAHPSVQHLSFIHQVLEYAHRNQFSLVPYPLPSMEGRSFLIHLGHLWELTFWMPGVADYEENQTEDRLKKAVQCLAQFHQSVKDFPAVQHKMSTSRCLNSRYQRWHDFERTHISQIEQAVIPEPWYKLKDYIPDLVNGFKTLSQPISETLLKFAKIDFEMQPCIRDIWHDHILFQNDEVSAIVDFGAMDIDNIAVDIARLLGSIASDQDKSWDLGLKFYQEVRPLKSEELSLVQVADQSAVLMSGLNWVNWILLDQKDFYNRQAVIDRIEKLTHRLNRAVANSL